MMPTKSQLRKSLRIVEESYAAHTAERDAKVMAIERKYDPIITPLARELTRLRRLCRAK